MRCFEYFKDPTDPRVAHPRSGWSTLGDIGYMDAEGYLYLTDRKAFMIISGGVNIYPHERGPAGQPPRGADVAVFGIPDEDIGEEVKAVVQPADCRSGAGSRARLVDYCREQLPRSNVPARSISSRNCRA